MKIDRTQNSRDDRTRICQSYGSLYHGGSQSRKISIGVMIDSLDKWKPKTTNEQQFALPSNEKTFKTLSSIGGLSEREQAKANGKENQIDQDNNSPWVSAKSTHPRKPTSEAVHNAKPTNDSPTGGTEFHKSNVDISANQKSVLQSTTDNMNKAYKVYSRRGSVDEGEREGTQGSPSPTAEKVFVSEKVVAEDKGSDPKERRQVLKMKLWEILGVNSAPHKQASQSLEAGVNNLDPKPGINQKPDAAIKPKQNSDTIESDSQSPDHTIKRAVTRSLTRKKVASKAPTSKPKNVQKFTNTKKSLEKNVFCFDGQSGKVNDAVSDGSPKSNRKNQRKKVSKVEARRINFLDGFNAGEAQPQIGKSTKGAEKTSLIGNNMRSYQSSAPKNRSEFVAPENVNKEDEFSLLSATKKGGKGSKGDSPRFSFSDKLISEEIQPAKDISETIKGANKVSLVGNRMRSYQNILPQSTTTFLGAVNKNQEKSSSLLSGTKRRKKGSKVEGNNDTSLENNADEVQPAVNTSEKAKGAKKASTNRKRKISYQMSPPDSSKFVDAEDKNQEKGFSPLATKKNKGSITILRTPHHWVQLEASGTSPLKKTMDPHADLESPVFKFRTPAETFSPFSPPKDIHGELDNQSPVNYSFNSPLNSKPDWNTPVTGTRKSNISSDTEESDGSPLTKSGPTREEKDADDDVYKSSPEKMDDESSKEAEEMSPDIGSSGNAEFVLYPNKRVRSQVNLKFQRFTPILPSPEGLEEHDGSQGLPEKNEENELANAISLLALALQRVQSKIKTVTSKKSIEVLMSVAEEVHAQLQKAEFQFERDVGKLKSLNKSKRKQLETEFEEQQEQLKVIYQKFKADISQHIQENKGRVEGLEGQEKELRLFMEKRKASQREVLKQLEESIQVQLSDAETRIAAVQKSGREKMLQLKQALGKCLKEGMLG